LMSSRALCQRGAHREASTIASRCQGDQRTRPTTLRLTTMSCCRRSAFSARSAARPRRRWATVRVRKRTKSSIVAEGTSATRGGGATAASAKSEEARAYASGTLTERRCAGSRRARRQATCRTGDEGDDGLKLTEDLMLTNPQHMPAKLVERAVTRGIMPCTRLVVRPINLDDEPHLGARKVDDVLANDELTPKRKSSLGPREPAPEPLLRACGIATHAGCTLFEELSASGRNESTTKHEDLHEVGADARRVKLPSAACVTRDGRHQSPHPSRAASKVRARSSARGRADRRLSGSARSSRPASSMPEPLGPRHLLPLSRAGRRPSTNLGEAAGEARWEGASHYAYNALGALKVNAGVTLDDQRPKLAGGGTADAAVPANVGGQPVVLDLGGRVTSLRGTTFQWVEDGALREVNEPIPAVAEKYGIDAHGRRFSRILGGSVQEYYVYEGLDRIATMGPNLFQVVPGPVLESYLFDGIDHPLRIKIAATSTTAYYELDLAGNVRGLRASGGASLGGYRFSAFGVTVEDTTSITQPLRWKSRWYSPVAGGTYDVRARQWSPELGIFLSVDEFEYHSPKTTLWGWPNQNPVKYRDPQGRGVICTIVFGVPFCIYVPDSPKPPCGKGDKGDKDKPKPSEVCDLVDVKPGPVCVYRCASDGHEFERDGHPHRDPSCDKTADR